MIEHKVSIGLQRESTENKSNKKPFVAAANVWQIFISGDLAADDPQSAISLLEELQAQVEKIRRAY